jgi:hypothetical protein
MMQLHIWPLYRHTDKVEDVAERGVAECQGSTISVGPSLVPEFANRAQLVLDQAQIVKHSFAN